MRNSLLALGLAIALLFGMATPPESFAQAPTVINVLAIDVNGDLDGFLDMMKKIRKITERLGSKGTARVWQATLSGDQTGTIFVAVEHPSLVSMAQDNAKLQADSKWQDIVKKFNKKGMDVLSNSVSMEITP